MTARTPCLMKEAGDPKFADAVRLIESFVDMPRKPAKRVSPKAAIGAATRAKPKVTRRGADESKRASARTNAKRGAR